MRFFLKFAYNGQKFHGWQSQPNAISVQQMIEEALSTVLRLPIQVIGAGRTDAGVHAREMYAHFDFPPVLPEVVEKIVVDEQDYRHENRESASEMMNLTGKKDLIKEKKRIILSLNRILGNDIAISDIIPVANDAHARFDAIERTYKYFISFEKTPFLYPYFWHSPSHLDLDKMNEAAALLLGTDDFTSFAKLHSDAKTNICDVRLAEWQTIPTKSSANFFFSEGLIKDGAVFTISADRFLRNMVRAIVGTLVDVGRGKLSLEGFKDIVGKKDRCSAGTSMPGNALFLWQVRYPYL